MTEMLYALAFLACPIGMGAAMWLMMRGGRTDQDPHTASELAALRSEVDTLRAQRGSPSATGRAEEAN